MNTFITGLWVFAVFSFLGWFIKFVPLSIVKHRLVNPGIITLPFLPAAGFGAVAIWFITSRLHNYAMIFFSAAIIITIGKYLISMAFEKTLGFKWRDYSKRALNLNGYVTLWESIGYGIAAMGMRLWAYDLIKTLICALPFWVALIVPLIVIGLIVTDFVVSIITILHLRRNLKQMSNISTLIDDGDSDKTNDELFAEYERKMVTSKRFRRRLVRAFPDMESLNYEKQLTDLKERFDVIRVKNDAVYEIKISEPEERPFAYGLSFAKLFWLFFVGSFFGTVLETIWALFTMGHFEVRVGMVWGPFIPVYGGGAVAITLFLYKLHKAGDILVYLASAVIGATFEYVCSYFQETVLGTVSWDYSDTPFNIDGRTNLMFALIWGLLGLFWLRYIYPWFSRLIEKIPKKKGAIITIILVVFMAINGAMSMFAVWRQAQRHEGVKPQNAIVEWVDNTFNDDYMNFIFPHMQDSKKK